MDHTHPDPHDHLGTAGPASSRPSSGISHPGERGGHPLSPRTGWGWLSLYLSPQINFFIFIRILGILVSKLRTRQMRCPDYRLRWGRAEGGGKRAGRETGTRAARPQVPSTPRLARSTLTLVPLLGVHEVVFAPVIEEQARGRLRFAKLGFEIFLSSFQVLRPGAGLHPPPGALLPRGHKAAVIPCAATEQGVAMRVHSFYTEC